MRISTEFNLFVKKIWEKSRRYYVKKLISAKVVGKNESQSSRLQKEK